MPYSINKPPFSLVFSEMSRADLRAYFEWFFSVLPERLRELTNAIRDTPGFESWEADQTPSSLDRLGSWFASQVETRQRTTAEIEAISNGSPYPIAVPNEELTNRTFSLALDVAMYLGGVFQANCPSLKWEQQFGSKKHIDYGQPILVGFGEMALNPVHVLMTLAYGIASKRKTGSGLREIYDRWSKKITRV